MFASERVVFVVGRVRSHRQACALLSIVRSTVTTRWRLPERDAPILAALRELAGQYRATPFGACRSSFASRGDLSAYRAQGLRRVEGLQVPRRRSPRRVATAASHASDRPRKWVWAYGDNGNESWHAHRQRRNRVVECSVHRTCRDARCTIELAV